MNAEPRKELGPSTGTSGGPTAKGQIQEKHKPEDQGAGEEEGSHEERSEAGSAHKLGMMPETEDSGVSSAKGRGAEEEEESGGSQRSKQAEGEMKRQSKWRESMPEGERWRAYEMEPQQGDKNPGWLADGEEEDDDDEDSVNWMPEKAALVFTPQVNIVNQCGRESAPGENTQYDENTYAKDDMYEKEPQVTSAVDVHQYSEWPEEEDGYICKYIQ